MILENLLNNKRFLSFSYFLFKRRGLFFSNNDIPFESKEIIDLNFGRNEYIFNPAILKVEEGYVFLARLVNRSYSRMLVGGIVDRNYEFTNPPSVVQISNENILSIDWQADPRLFKSSDRILGTFNTGHSEFPNRNFLFELNTSGNLFTSLQEIVKSSNRRGIEKNWGVFDSKNELFAVYSISPWVIVKIKKNNDEPDKLYAEEIFRFNWDSSKFEDKFGDLRGGAFPFLFEGSYYYITQSHVKTVFGKVYFGSMVEFESKPPFKIKKVSSSPLFKLTKDEYLTQPKVRLNKGLCAALYPSSVNFDRCENKLTLGYGINDYRIGIRSYNFNLLKDKLMGITKA